MQAGVKYFDPLLLPPPSPPPSFVEQSKREIQPPYTAGKVAMKYETIGIIFRLVSSSTSTHRFQAVFFCKNLQALPADLAKKVGSVNFSIFSSYLRRDG